MSWIPFLFNEIFYRPLFNGLVLLTDFLPSNDLGFAVIILTVLVRLVLFPLTHRSTQTQTKMKMIEPDLKKIRDDFKDREEQARRTMELYKAHGINPFSSILLLFIQLPILIALYLVFREDLAANASYLYSFVSLPENIHTSFLGLIDLSGRSVFLAVLAGASQFLQMKLAQPPKIASSGKPAGKEKPDFSQMFAWQMTYMMPAFIFIIALRFPAAVSLYWTTINTFAILHEGMIRKKAQKIYGERGQGNPKIDSSPSGKNGLPGVG